LSFSLIRARSRPKRFTAIAILQSFLARERSLRVRRDPQHDARVQSENLLGRRDERVDVIASATLSPPMKLASTGLPSSFANVVNRCATTAGPVTACGVSTTGRPSFPRIARHDEPTVFSRSPSAQSSPHARLA